MITVNLSEFIFSRSAFEALEKLKLVNKTVTVEPLKVFTVDSNRDFLLFPYQKGNHSDLKKYIIHHPASQTEYVVSLCSDKLKEYAGTDLFDKKYNVLSITIQDTTTNETPRNGEVEDFNRNDQKQHAAAVEA
jgi:hypothetical protein